MTKRTKELYSPGNEYLVETMNQEINEVILKGLPYPEHAKEVGKVLRKYHLGEEDPS